MNDPISELALMMYANEPCRICGKNILESDVHTAVFAGYSNDSKSRGAHKECWDSNTPKEQWAYPVDNQISFEDWCYSKQIKGNWKEALFHHLAATHSVEEMDTLTEEDWKRGWYELLKETINTSRA